MPEGAEDAMLDSYRASVIFLNREFLISWVQDDKIEQLLPKLITKCIANSGVSMLDSWYQDDEIVYMTAGNNIVAAKKLSLNEWYVYSGSKTFVDYVLTGVMDVHK